MSKLVVWIEKMYADYGPIVTSGVIAFVMAFLVFVLVIVGNWFVANPQVAEFLERLWNSTR